MDGSQLYSAPLTVESKWSGQYYSKLEENIRSSRDSLRGTLWEEILGKNQTYFILVFKACHQFFSSLIFLLCNQQVFWCKQEAFREMFFSDEEVWALCSSTLKLVCGQQERACLPPPSPLAERKCVSRTECPHGLTGYSNWLMDDSANTKEAVSCAKPVGKRSSEVGGVWVLLEWAWLNECCEECSQTRVI